MRVQYRSLSNRLRAIVLPLVLSLALPAAAAAQIVKLTQTPAQESKQRDSSAAQTPAAPRVDLFRGSSETGH